MSSTLPRGMFVYALESSPRLDGLCEHRIHGRRASDGATDAGGSAPDVRRQRAWPDARGGARRRRRLRSVLGLMKHTAGWSEVYHSFAFDSKPHGWDDADWPAPPPRTHRTLAGLRRRGLGVVRARRRRLACGGRRRRRPRRAETGVLGRHAPLREIVAIVAGHWQYHACEINAILAIRRGEAWEFGEAVEENHIGRSVRREWISDEDAERYEERLREPPPSATREPASVDITVP